MQLSPKAGRPLLWAAGLCVVLSACGATPSPAPTPTDPYARLESQAVADARAVVGSALVPGTDVTFHVVADQQALESAIGASAGSDRDVAAVAAVPPGSTTPAVFIDAAAMDQLTDQGVRIVLTHEATHVLTGVVGNTQMPLWLVEGFADYVALRPVHKPVSVTAGRILAEVRHGRVPGRLPLQADFDAARQKGADAYTAEYEASWLACRLLAHTGGEQSLIHLYMSVRDGTKLAPALRATFHLTLQSFTHRWQQTLRSLT